jgi:putative hydrolase of the HAD superfamily
MVGPDGWGLDRPVDCLAKGLAARGEPFPTRGVKESCIMLKALAFDWGHTVMDEGRDSDIPLDARPVHLMPGVSEVLPQLALPVALWANTRGAGETEVRGWLERAGLNRFFRWVITSVDAGARKPSSEFFQYALTRCGLAREDVLFVGNQLNTDVSGAEAFGICTVWLSGPEYHSVDDAPCNVSPTHTIRTLNDLPALLQRLKRTVDGRAWGPGPSV